MNNKNNGFIARDLEDLVLPAKGGLRGKPHQLLKGGRVFASVFKGFSPWNRDYAMPSLTLKVEHKWDDGSTYDNTLLIVAFQKDRTSSDRLENGGYLADLEFGHKWSGAYAGKIEGRLDSSEYLQVGLGLLDRAQEALKTEDGRRFRNMMLKDGPMPCQLRMLIEGLRQIGISVVIEKGKVKSASHAEAETCAGNEVSAVA